MRLIRHLNERKKLADYYNTPPVQKDYTELEMNLLLELVQKECKPWLKEVGDFSITTIPNPVFRGTEENVRIFRVKKGSRRTDRIPKFTQREVFEIFDKAFADRFGWWVRSKGVFTGSEHVAYGYGKTYIFFPMGKYRYVWSVKYQKVWHNLTSPGTWEMKTDTQKKDHLIGQEQIAKEAVKFYQDRNIRGTMRKDNVAYEAIFDCKKYLLMTHKAFLAISGRL
jgi:hypothetical protein